MENKNTPINKSNSNKNRLSEINEKIFQSDSRSALYFFI